MTHVTTERLHAYVKRGLDVRVAVASSIDPADLSAITFRVGDGVVEKNGLTADPVTGGFNVDVILTEADLDVESKRYTWELVATLAGTSRSVALGDFFVSPEPTPSS